MKPPLCLRVGDIMAKEQLAVVCRGITKKYGTGNQTVFALDGVDFEVRAGELMMIAGPSGSGKTTLISVIAGILDYNDGDCFVYGEDLNQMTEVQKLAFRAKNIGFVFQQFNLVDRLPVMVNVLVGALHRMPWWRGLLSRRTGRR